MAIVRFLLFLVVIFTITTASVTAQEFRCTGVSDYTSAQLAVGTDITSLSDFETRIVPCTENAAFQPFACNLAATRSVICVTNNIIVVDTDCLTAAGEEEPPVTKPATTLTYESCSFQCYLADATFTGYTTPLPLDTDLSALVDGEADQIGPCDQIPAQTCQPQSTTTPDRTIACISHSNRVIDPVYCSNVETTTPGTQRTDPGCIFYCSSAPFVETDVALIDPATTAVCTDTNFFPEPSCNPHTPQATRYVGCEINGILSSPCPIPAPTPEQEPIATTPPTPSADCVYFYHCANTQDQFVRCDSTTLTEQLCDPIKFPKLEEEFCNPNPDSLDQGSLTREFQVQCVTAMGCFDPANPDMGFNHNYCTDLYEFQTSVLPCTTRNVIKPTYQCPCEPEQAYRCAASNTTVEQITADPSLLGPCDQDRFFPTPDRVLGCMDYIATRYRSVFCFDVHGQPELVSPTGENTTQCAGKQAPTSSKTYTGNIDCKFVIKCAAYNQTVSDITINSPDCPLYNANSPSPCFTQPLVDRFSLWRDANPGWDETEPTQPDPDNQPTPNVQSFPSTLANYITNSLDLDHPQSNLFSTSSAPVDSFCNPNNKRMTGSNGFQHRTQTCIATMTEIGVDGTEVTLSIDPNLIGYDQNCPTAPNFSNSTMPDNESCCTCKIGYGSGFQAEPKQRDIPGDQLDRPWNHFNNCRLCQGYGVLVFPSPPDVLTQLLVGDYQSYNTAIDNAVIEYGKENVTLAKLLNPNALLEEKKTFLLDLVNQLRTVGEFIPNNENPVFIEDRFISVMGLDNTTNPAVENYYTLDSVRKDDYTPINGDLIIIITVAGLCQNSESKSLAKAYGPWRTLRADLALPKIPLNNTDSSSFFPFNPFKSITPIGDPIFSTMATSGPKQKVSPIKFAQDLLGTIITAGNAGVDQVNIASAVMYDNNNSTNRGSHPITDGTTVKSQINTSYSNTQALAVKTDSTGYHNTQSDSTTAKIEELFQIGGKNSSVLYNSKIFEKFFITNVTSQAMYSPTCTDYYDCPTGRSPFTRAIDDNDRSQNTTYIVIALSIVVLFFCVVFIIYMAICGSSSKRTYEPLHKYNKNPYYQSSESDTHHHHHHQLNNLNDNNNIDNTHTNISTTNNVEMSQM